MAVSGYDSAQALQEESYAELCARSSFSFLQGASQPEELVQRAHALGLRALGICDRDGLYGIVRAYAAARELGLKLIVGTELFLQQEGEDYGPVRVLVRSEEGYRNLCRLVTRAHQDQPKGTAKLALEQLLSHAQGLTALIPAPYHRTLCEKLREAFGREHSWLVMFRHLDPEQKLRESEALSRARWLGLGIVASACPVYHQPSRKPLADVLACIRKGITLDEAGTLLGMNAEAFLQSPQRMKRLFRDRPEWVEATLEVAGGCEFSIGSLRYRFPCETWLKPGQSADQVLEELVQKGLPWRYPQGVPERVRETVQKELKLIEQLGVAPYFLSVYEIVQIAKDRQILCQGRGSAANSAVCYVLGITAVDPARSNLLFERFMSPERKDPPDIDVDFEHERREEVIQEIYRRFGRDRAAMVSEVICYRGKSALRDVGKVFGLSLEQVERLSSALTHSYELDGLTDVHLKEVGLDPKDRRVRQVLLLAKQLQRHPRHLSIHVGGFVLSATNLDEIAPVEPATMPGRTVIPWDKDDLDTLGFFKMDVLALGMLSCIRKALSVVMPGLEPLRALASIAPEDERVYEALCRADSIGVFQVESRAQMAMLPRLRPKCFYDLVIQVAIVRPGPIQGGMVHPYLKRRSGQAEVSCPHPCLWPILKRTLGVPLFQEQVMQIAIAGAGYTGGEADQLRRDMAAWKKHGRLMQHRERLLAGFVRRGISLRFGEQLFRQIQGFGEYGFPESHAASFALLVYASAWLKVHYPAQFACALINSQPMGFYSPSSILKDAKAHGVQVFPVCVSQSGWDCELEPGAGGALGIRLGLRLIRGVGQKASEVLLAERQRKPFSSIEELIDRTALRKDVLEALAEAGALEALMTGRRQALWQVRAPRSGPLFAGVPAGESVVGLRPLRQAEQLVLDYARVGLSIDDHPLGHLRAWLEKRRVLTAEGLLGQPSGSEVGVAGLVLNRQRPYTASGVVFMTLEDETGLTNLLLRAAVFERQRHTAVHARLLIAWGKLERKDGVTHLLVRRLERLDGAQGEQSSVGQEMEQLAVRSRDFH